MRAALRWLLLLVAGVGAVGGAYYGYQYVRPCARPVSYAIGAVDPRFEIAPADLIRTAESAASIWNKAAGKKVLAYDSEAKLMLNLMYDEREETAKLGIQIARAQAETDATRASIDSLQEQYEAELTAYNKQVRAVNARGGATKREAKLLTEQQASLNLLLASIKSKVASYNARVAAINAQVAEYNKSAGQTFREGEYIRDTKGERINVFQFIGTAQLTRVLAHEFGHAIGLGHNDDPKAIMFAKNESGNLTPAAADLAALKSLCGV